MGTSPVIHLGEGGSTGRPRPGELRVVPSPPAIETRALTRVFGDRVALEGLSLEVGRGAVHALLGPNGAGKTVTLRMLTGLLTPTAGSVRVMGADVALGHRSVRALIGFVPSGDRTFYLRLSALENLMFFARLHGLRRREARRRALAVLEQVGLADRAARPGGHVLPRHAEAPVGGARPAHQPVGDPGRRGHARPRPRGRRRHPGAGRRAGSRRRRRALDDPAPGGDPRLRRPGHAAARGPAALRGLGQRADGPCAGAPLRAATRRRRARPASRRSSIATWARRPPSSRWPESSSTGC